MSYYIFPPEQVPAPEVYAFLKGVFSPEECLKIIEYGKSLGLKDSTVLDKDSDIGTKARRSENSWIHFNDDSLWIYERLGYTVRVLNKQFWNLPISGFWDQIQFTKYEKDYFYDWHKDTGSSTFPRKLSMVLQLSDPKDYEGGNLDFFQSQLLNPVPLEQGTLILFPSNEWHCVKPVTRGTRYSLVSWLS